MRNIIYIVITLLLCTHHVVLLSSENKTVYPSMPALRTMLIDMEYEDQEIRKILSDKLNPSQSEKQLQTLSNIDKVHTHKIKNIFAKYGWPNSSMVGYDGVHAFWVLAQHTTDNDFRHALMPHVQAAFDNGDLNAQCYARFVDRLLVYKGKQQKYGTQIKEVVDKKLIPFPIADPSNVDALRASIGLLKLKDYLSMPETVKENNKLPLLDDYTQKYNGGIGVKLNIDFGGDMENMTVRTLTVTEVKRGSTADKANIQVNDRIVEIDGMRVEGSKINKIMAAVDKPVGTNVVLVVKRLDGNKDKIVLQISASDEE